MSKIMKEYCEDSNVTGRLLNKYSTSGIELQS